MTTAPVFLVPTEALALDRILLDGPEGRHAAGVRRLGVGERVDLVDGTGRRVQGVVSLVHAREALTVDVLERYDEPRPAPAYVVVQALPKGDRGELAVELMTEAGVDEVVPWAATRCVTKWSGDRGAKSLAKWRSTAAEAAKQSRRASWPVVSELATTRQVAARCAAGRAYVLHEGAELPLALVRTSSPAASAGAVSVGVASPGASSADTVLPGSSSADTVFSGTAGVDEVLLVVGPEGGIDDAELATLLAAGAQSVRLGPEVVRTSTAGVLGLAVLSAGGRWAR